MPCKRHNGACGTLCDILFAPIIVEKGYNESNKKPKMVQDGGSMPPLRKKGNKRLTKNLNIR